MKIRYLSISGKCSDCCSYSLTDEEGTFEFSSHGYVPDGLGVGGDDYLELKIDLKTGQILNWTPPTDEAIQKILQEKS